jgi:hypothetical protein
VFSANAYRIAIYVLILDASIRGFGAIGAGIARVVIRRREGRAGERALP